jgi:hypothetical protein
MSRSRRRCWTSTAARSACNALAAVDLHGARRSHGKAWRTAGFVFSPGVTIRQVVAMWIRSHSFQASTIRVARRPGPSTCR